MDTDVDTKEALHQGWGEKEGGRHKGLRRRYLVLRRLPPGNSHPGNPEPTNAIFYYKFKPNEAQMSENVGAMPISPKTIVGEGWAGSKRCVTVNTPGVGREYKFVAEHGSKTWLPILRKAILGEDFSDLSKQPMEISIDIEDEHETEDRGMVSQNFRRGPCVRGQTLKLRDDEFDVVLPGSMVTKTCRVVLRGDGDRRGQGVLEFYHKASGVRRVLDGKQHLPTIQVKLDSGILSIKDGTAKVGSTVMQIQVIHLERGTFALRSKDCNLLKAWYEDIKQLSTTRPIKKHSSSFKNAPRKGRGISRSRPKSVVYPSEISTSNVEAETESDPSSDEEYGFGDLEDDC